MFPVKLLVVLKAHKSSESDLRAVLFHLREKSLCEQGCQEYRVEQSTSQPEYFFLLEKWVDTAAMASHEKTKHFITGVARVNAYCESVETYRLA